MRNLSPRACDVIIRKPSFQPADRDRGMMSAGLESFLTSTRPKRLAS